MARVGVGVWVMFRDTGVRTHRCHSIIFQVGPSIRIRVRIKVRVRIRVDGRTALFSSNPFDGTKAVNGIYRVRVSVSVDVRVGGIIKVREKLWSMLREGKGKC